eukprot:scaffold538_cov166-Amphora_coffeaeformis.AAC.14
MNGSSLGVTLKLGPEAAQQLRRRRPRRTVVELYPEEEEGSAPAAKEEIDGPNENNDGEHQLPQHPQEDGNDDLADVETNNEHYKDNPNNDDSDDDASTVVSLSPPPTLPLVLVDTERLIGYRPSTMEELDMLQTQVQSALWGTTDNDNTTAAAGFETRVADMMESALGRHMDTGQAAMKGILAQDGDRRYLHRSTWPALWSHWTVVEYPDYVCWNKNSNKENTSDQDVVVLSTRRLWKSLYTSTAIPVVDHLVQLVRDCSRPLGWKAHMASAIRRLGRTEAAAKRERQEARALERWRTTQRPQELEKLYTVRETLVHKVEMEEERLKKLIQERDVQVALQLRQARLVTGEAVGLEGLDFATTNSVLLPDEPLVLLNDDIDLAASADKDNMWDILQGGTDTVQDEADYAAAAEWSQQNDDNDSYQAEDEHESGGEGIFERTKKTTDAVAKSNKTTDEVAERHQAEEAAYRQKLATAKAQEAAMREACTTNELRTVEAIVKALKERLGKTDSLLETMQDEEWAEQGYDEDVEDGAVTQYEFQDESKDASSSRNQLSLLDQILAMVFHAFPTPVGENEQNHILWKQVEHETVVMDWKAHFGRIPPGAALEGASAGWEPSKYAATKPTTLQSKEELKESLGITDNAEDDWDCEDSDWDDVETDKQPQPTKPPAPSRPSVAGLRPGGKIS